MEPASQSANMKLCNYPSILSLLCVQVVGGKMTETGRLGAFITKVKKGSLADVVGHLRAGANPSNMAISEDIGIVI